MSERFVVIQGVVGSDAFGISIHQGTTRTGRDCSLAYIGLPDKAEMLWQEIELSPSQAIESTTMLSCGNIVRVSGILDKQFGLPVYRLQVEEIQLVRAAQPFTLSTAA